MSSNTLVRVGHAVLDLSQVASAHWEGSSLFVYLAGGRFRQFKGDEANHFWQAILRQAVDLQTGEVNAE